MMRQVLFVCTGNVFRSLTAEYALRTVLDHRPDIAVTSAGTQGHPELVPPEVAEYLMQKGLDVRAHRRRTLTQRILEPAHLVIAMSIDHREFIRVHFGRGVPLFLECCGDHPGALPDLEEAVSDYRSNRPAALAYIRSTIDRIVELTPRLAGRIDVLLCERL